MIQNLKGFNDDEIPDSLDRKIPKFLILTYILLPLWGFLWLYFFWNGSFGFFDPGYWQPLQKAANTISSSQEDLDKK